MSKNNLKSDVRLQKGYLKVAGLFFSKKALPTQAKPYPTRERKIHSQPFKMARKCKISTRKISKKCNIRLVSFRYPVR
jgi:hypothetical protein